MSFSILKKLQLNTNKPIKVWQRSIKITENFVGSIFSIHNGKSFINIMITSKMINKKLGEFSLTRRFPKHLTKDKKLTNKKQKMKNKK